MEEEEELELVVEVWVVLIDVVDVAVVDEAVVEADVDEEAVEDVVLVMDVEEDVLLLVNVEEEVTVTVDCGRENRRMEFKVVVEPHKDSRNPRFQDNQHITVYICVLMKTVN